jgi:hypothetical protein
MAVSERWSIMCSGGGLALAINCSRNAYQNQIIHREGNEAGCHYASESCEWTEYLLL